MSEPRNTGRIAWVITTLVLVRSAGGTGRSVASCSCAIGYSREEYDRSTDIKPSPGPGRQVTRPSWQAAHGARKPAPSHPGRALHLPNRNERKGGMRRETKVQTRTGPGWLLKWWCLGGLRLRLPTTWTNKQRVHHRPPPHSPGPAIKPNTAQDHAGKLVKWGLPSPPYLGLKSHGLVWRGRRGKAREEI